MNANLLVYNARPLKKDEMILVLISKKRMDSGSSPE